MRYTSPFPRTAGHCCWQYSSCGRPAARPSPAQKPPATASSSWQQPPATAIATAPRARLTASAPRRRWLRQHPQHLQHQAQQRVQQPTGPRVLREPQTLARPPERPAPDPPAPRQQLTLQVQRQVLQRPLTVRLQQHSPPQHLHHPLIVIHRTLILHVAVRQATCPWTLYPKVPHLQQWTGVLKRQALQPPQRRQALQP